MGSASQARRQQQFDNRRGRKKAAPVAPAEAVPTERFAERCAVVDDPPPAAVAMAPVAVKKPRKPRAKKAAK